MRAKQSKQVMVTLEADELLVLGEALDECEQDFAKRWKNKPERLRTLSNAIRKVRWRAQCEEG
jgi:hypothetical protein